MTITREITFNVAHDTHNEVPPAIIKKIKLQNVWENITYFPIV